jgi:hypothetical protein
MKQHSSRPKTLQEVALRVAGGESFRFELADFLDEFQQAVEPNADALTEAPPLLAGKVADGSRCDCFLAAVAETLARRNGWRTPDWTFDAERSLDEPSFDFSTREGRLFLLKDSPAAFKSRNLFVTGAVLDRV